MTRLREALRSRNEQLWRQVESLVDRATPQLWHTWSTFQTGTKHTPEHTQTVEEIASLLLSDDVIAQLQDDEIAILILACHYHDLGLAGTEADNKTGEGRDRVRKEHAISIGERIRDVSSVVTLRANASLDASRRLLVFTCHRLRPGLQDELPVIVTLPSNRPRGSLNVTFSMRQRPAIPLLQDTTRTGASAAYRSILVHRTPCCLQVFACNKSRTIPCGDGVLAKCE